MSENICFDGLGDTSCYDTLWSKQVNIDLKAASRVFNTVLYHNYLTAKSTQEIFRHGADIRTKKSNFISNIFKRSAVID